MKKIIVTSISIIIAMVAMATGARLWFHSHTGNHWSIDVEDLDSISFAEPGMLELSFYEKTLPNSGGRFTLGITANKPWTASVNDPGLILGATFGDGNAQLAVTAMPNTDEGNPYTGIITITLSNGVYKQVVVTLGSKHVKIESIEFKSAQYEIAENYLDLNLKKQLVVVPENILDTAKIIWTVSDENIAVMNGSYLVPNRTGDVRITATIQGKSASCRVGIAPVPVESIFLEDMTVTLYSSLQIKCTTIPSNVSLERIRFSSSNNNVASVTSDGIVQGKGIGAATITAMADGLTATCKVTVKKIDVASVTVTPESVRMYKIGETLQLAATVEPKNASFPEITWSSEPAGYVSVENGLVTVMKYYDLDSPVVVTAKADNQTDICNVKVWPQQSTSITLSSTSHIFTGVGKTFTLSIKDIQPTQRTLTDSFKWTTSNKSIAVINNTETVEGNITSVTVKCIANGTATITCEDTWSKVKAICTVSAVESGSVSDVCGNTYRTVKIGSQWWMAENMRCEKYDTQSERADATLSTSSDRTYAPYYTGASDKSLWNSFSQKHGVNLTSEQIDKLGYLYNWAATVGFATEAESKAQESAFSGNRQGICPNGWHVPTTAEWDALVVALGGGTKNGDGYFPNVGKLLKTTSGWYYGNGTDEYSFAALPAGYADGSTVDRVGSDAFFGTATPTRGRTLSCSMDDLGSDMGGKHYAQSVRCVKN